jgi:uncharacterized protein YbaA (DUF1428 family)
MSFIDGCIIAVPTANKDAYLEHAKATDALLKEYGAIQIVEGWGTDVPDGKVTDFKKAVQATSDETVVFAWILWPDKATRDAAWGKLMEDERMKNGPTPPYDGKRMVYGGFEAILET